MASKSVSDPTLTPLPQDCFSSLHSLGVAHVPGVEPMSLHIEGGLRLQLVVVPVEADARCFHDPSKHPRPGDYNP